MWKIDPASAFGCVAPVVPWRYGKRAFAGSRPCASADRTLVARMFRHCFRITFQNEQAAYFQFHVFPPVVHLPWINGWARKRDTNTQLLLVELLEEADRDRFLELCCENPHVLKIEEISEDEFTYAPSHEI